MAGYLIGLGSNIDPEANLMKAAQVLRGEFADVRFSSVYCSPAVGMDGDDFLNACCLLVTDLGVDALKQRLKQIEDGQGRDRSEGSWKPRTLDLDVLIADGQVVDDELYRYAHAYVPASELVALEAPSDIAGIVRRHVLSL